MHILFRSLPRFHPQQRPQQSDSTTMWTIKWSITTQHRTLVNKNSYDSLRRDQLLLATNISQLTMKDNQNTALKLFHPNNYHIRDKATVRCPTWEHLNTETIYFYTVDIYTLNKRGKRCGNPDRHHSSVNKWQLLSIGNEHMPIKYKHYNTKNFVRIIERMNILKEQRESWSPSSDRTDPSLRKERNLEWRTRRAVPSVTGYVHSRSPMRQTRCRYRLPNPPHQRSQLRLQYILLHYRYLAALPSYADIEPLTRIPIGLQTALAAPKY